MTNYPHILFNQSPDQLRRIGARGGKARARNWRARLQTQAPARPAIVAAIDPLPEMAAEAVALRRRETPGAQAPSTLTRYRLGCCGSIASISAYVQAAV